MKEHVIVEKIGAGTDADPYRPDTDESSWQVVEEREAEFVIELISSEK